MRSPRGRSTSLRTRLGVAFVAVAAGALGLLSALVLIAASRDVSRLAREEQDDTAAHVSAAAATAYTRAGGWSNADLEAAVVLAEDQGASLVVLDTKGQQVAASAGPIGSGRRLNHAVVVGGDTVGDIRLVFTTNALPAPEQHLRDALVRTVGVGAGLAAALALVTAAVIARHITRPMAALTAAARAMEAGDRKIRAGPAAGADELGQLATAFDRMADTLGREDALRRALLADIAHELRTPLAIVQASVEGMADGIIATTPAELESVRDDIVRLGRLVSDLEMLAAAEAAGLTLAPSRVDLAEVVANAEAQLRPQFNSAGLHIETHLSSAIITGDPQRLHQIATNLLTNAIKFTPPGGAVNVTVSADDAAARLVVDDTGVGIPSDELPYVFDRFWRGTHARATTGSGVGLTVVAELVAAHTGTVAVDTDSGRGTRFVVTLPRL